MSYRRKKIVCTIATWFLKCQTFREDQPRRLALWIRTRDFGSSERKLFKCLSTSFIILCGLTYSKVPSRVRFALVAKTEDALRRPAEQREKIFDIFSRPLWRDYSPLSSRSVHCEMNRVNMYQVPGLRSEASGWWKCEGDTLYPGLRM